MNNHSHNNLPFVLCVKKPESYAHASRSEILRSQEPLLKIPCEVDDQLLKWTPFKDEAQSSKQEEPGSVDRARHEDVSLTDIELKLLNAVAEYPGERFSFYAKLIGRNSTKAAEIRNELIKKRCLKEHRLSKAGVGAKAIVLELLPQGEEALGWSVK